MINLGSVKILLKAAGVSKLTIDFNEEQKCVNAAYIFKGSLSTKKITYQEIIDSLTIGLPKPPVCAGAAIAQESK